VTPRMTVPMRHVTWRTPDGVTHVVSRGAAVCGTDLDLAPHGFSQEEADCMACVASGTHSDTWAGLTKVTVTTPYAWMNAIDVRGIVHRVVSLVGVMRLCGARCGLDGRWDHAEPGPGDVLQLTEEDVSCMACVAAGTPT
jgi:hypothetical protein